MRILFFGAGFEPEVTALAPYNTDMCKYLTSRGHEVTAVVGFPNYPQWRKYDEYKGRLFAREDHDGVRVLRVPQYIPKKPTPIRRIAYDTTFALSALVAALVSGRRPDVMIVTCSPLQLGVTASILRRLWGRPFLFHIEDLLPEGAIALGMLKNRKAIAAANAMADFVYKRASVISGIGHSFLESLRRRGVPDGKLAYLPNWVDVNRISPRDRMTPWRVRQGVSTDKFAVMYIGNIGYKQDMSVVVEAAALLQDEPDIEFVIVGDGSERAKIEALREKLGLRNTHILGVQPAADLPDMAAAGDMFVVHQTRDVIDMVVPAKLQTYGSAGKPVLVAGVPESEGAQFILRSGGGIVVEPQNARAFADAVLALKRDPDRRAQMGRDIRSYIEKNFARETVLADLEHLLEQAERQVAEITARDRSGSGGGRAQ